MIQIQRWPTCDRVIVVDEENHGTVQVDILKREESKEHYEADALLWALWVDKPYRKKGTAKRLMETAENEAMKQGCKSIALEWSSEESKDFVWRWYERRGYVEKAFGRHALLFVKQLKTK